MTVQRLAPPLVRTLIALAMTGGAPYASAAGFQLNESSASGLGTAFAGGAAAAEDATTLWSNAAGMSRLRETQVAGAIHLIRPSIKFKNENSSPATGQALGGDGGDAGGLNVVPNLYVIAPLGAEWSVGLGLNSPFGLVTEYDSTWIGRFQAIKSSIRTINVNPALAWRPLPRVGVGLGANYQHIKAEFTNKLPPAAIGGLDATAVIEGTDTAWGWNAGVLWELDDKARAGAHYRSSIDYRVSGTVAASNPAIAAAFNSGVSADVKLPAIVNLSYFATLNDRWDVMLDAQWTQWSTIQTLRFVRANGAVLSSTPENFKDTWKVAVGANYRYNRTWLLRGGVAVDQSPVPDADRTPRLPDADRTWLALGLQYRISPALTFDAGAAYVLVKKASIDNSGSAPGSAVNARLAGHYDSNTLIASGQLTYSF